MLAISIFSPLAVGLVLLVILMVVGASVAALIIWLIKRGKQPAAAPRVPNQPQRTCPQCGAPLAADAPEGLCPQCLLKVALDSRADAAGSTVDVPPGHLAPTTLKPEQTWGATPPDPKELGKLFPKLEILELIGRGGMGAVYKARQPALDRLVALKILPPESGRDQAFAERFVREARALAKLSHPNIVAVYDFGKAGDFFYFVMEFVDGVNLRQMEQAGKRTPAEALAMIPKICDALQFAHEEGVVHRDIKPENILVDKKGRVKIADFGLAKLLGKAPSDVTLTRSGQAMGTLNYMAPEQMEKPLTVDHRADIYSLGVVFYEMLTGELPLGRFAPPSQKAQIDVRLDEVVLKTLEKEPERRYQHVSEVRTDVEKISSTFMPHPPQAAPLPEVRPNRRMLWRRVRLLATLVVWTSLIVGAFAYLVPLIWNDWWPWEFKEYRETSLEPQSRAYTVSLRVERKVYMWGQHYDRPIFRQPWTGTALIDLPSRRAAVTLEYDSLHEHWRWDPPINGISTGGPSFDPKDRFVGLIKAAGVDTAKPGVLEEAAELVRLVRDGATGVMPGGTRAEDFPSLAGGTKIGLFTAHGSSGSGLTIGAGAIGPVDSHLVALILVLLIWTPGLVTIMRRHRRWVAAAGEPEQRYRFGAVGSRVALLCLLGAIASMLGPWVEIPSGLRYGVHFGALDNWYGTASVLTILVLGLYCFVTEFLSVGRFWQPRLMIAAGAVLLAATGVLFWELSSPATEQAGLVTSAGHSAGVYDVGRWGWGKSAVARSLEQHSGGGLWVAFVTGLALLVLGCVSILRARRRRAGATPPSSNVLMAQTQESQP